MTKNTKFLLTMCVVLLLISLTFNIILLNKMESNNIHKAYHGYFPYLLVTKLDRQSHILDYIGIYCNKVQDGEMTVGELKFYLKGVKHYTQNDIFAGLHNILYESNEGIKDTLIEISGVICTTDEIIEYASLNDLDELSEIYAELGNLLDRNNKEDSLTYYLLKNSYDDSNSFNKVLKKVNSILSDYRSKHDEILRNR